MSVPILREMGARIHRNILECFRIVLDRRTGEVLLQ